MRKYSLTGWVATLLFNCPLVLAARNEQEKLLVTSPPNPDATSCSNTNVLKRQESCQFGQCGDSCLSQGAFCCGPAGTLATSPYWVCDNGACITSVRGTTGIVDCYDPDNPSGTTQSCIDHKPTATCNPTDRCYTCDPDAPYCRWETYIAPNSPTLRWFSCVETKIPDTTFLAATITPLSSPSSHSLATSPSTSQSTAQNNTAQSNTENNNTEHKSVLSTGAIIGIAVGGGIAIVGSVAIIAYCCLKKRNDRPHELSAGVSQPPVAQQTPMELDSRAYTRSELGSTTAYSPYSQPATPFAPPQDYTHNVQEVDIWRHGAGMTPTELQTQKPDYVAQSPRELYGERNDVRASWQYGDEREHMSATERY